MAIVEYSENPTYEDETPLAVAYYDECEWKTFQREEPVAPAYFFLDDIDDFPTDPNYHRNNGTLLDGFTSPIKLEPALILTSLFVPRLTSNPLESFVNGVTV